MKNHDIIVHPRVGSCPLRGAVKKDLWMNTARLSAGKTFSCDLFLCASGLRRLVYEQYLQNNK